MTTKHVILVGTRKGGFVVEPDSAGARIRGPFCATMPIQHLTWDPASRALLAGAGSPWYGADRVAQHRPRRDLEPVQ